MSVLAIIPARYGSVRFPGKPLATLQGKPVIQHVYEQVAKAARVDDVVVATDDDRIREAVERCEGRVVMTSADIQSGTDRAADVARGSTASIIINVQGDEPLVQPEMVDQLAVFLEEHGAVPMASLMTPLARSDAFANPNVVKVVVDRDGFALYFSRAPIPYLREDLAGSRLKAEGSRQAPWPPGQSPQRAYKHLGIYGYQRHFLLQFPHLEPTPLEQSERLEQLRALEHGYRIKPLETAHDTIGIDTPDDLRRVEALLAGAKREA